MIKRKVDEDEKDQTIKSNMNQHSTSEIFGSPQLNLVTMGGDQVSNTSSSSNSILKGSNLIDSKSKKGAKNSSNSGSNSTKKRSSNSKKPSTSDTNSNQTEGWPPDKPISYIEEIRKMMHSFGDAKHPLLPAAQVIQEIVHQQLVWMLTEAQKIALNRGATKIGLYDLLFLVRTDRVKLARLLRYLSVMDKRVKLQTSIQVGPNTSTKTPMVASELASMEMELFEVSMEEEGALTNQPVECSKADRIEKCQDFLLQLQTSQNPLVHLIQWEQQEPFLLCRARRLDAFAQKLRPSEYLYFQMCRTISFLHPTGAKTAVKPASLQKFSHWIRSHPKNYRHNKPQEKLGQLELELEAWEVLNHFARETVATVVEMALELRSDKDGEKNSLDRHNLLSTLFFSDFDRFNNPKPLQPFPIAQYGDPVMTSAVYPMKPRIPLSNPAKRFAADSSNDEQSSMDLLRPWRPITKEEITEAMRKFEDTQKGTFSPDSRAVGSSLAQNNRIRLLLLRKSEKKPTKVNPANDLIIPMNYSV